MKKSCWHQLFGKHFYMIDDLDTNVGNHSSVYKWMKQLLRSWTLSVCMKAYAIWVFEYKASFDEHDTKTLNQIEDDRFGL